MNKAFFVLLLLSSLLFGQLQFQMEVVTHMNTSNQFWVEENRIVSATSGGLLIFDLSNNIATKITAMDGLYDHNLTAVAVGRNDLLILGSDGGNLAFVDQSTFTVSNDLNVEDNRIVDLLAVEDTLWVLSDQFVSVYLFDSQRSRYQFRESYQNFGVQIGELFTIEQANHRIWIGTDRGILNAPSDFLRNNLYAVVNWEIQSGINGAPSQEVRDLVYDPTSDELLLATRTGFYRYDFATYTNIGAGLVNRDLYNLTLADGQVYVTDPRRVYRLDGSQFTLLHTVAHTTINDLNLSPDGQVWVATVKRGLRNLTTGQRVLIDGPLDNYIGEILVDSRGVVWCTSGIIRDVIPRGIYIKTLQGWENYWFFGGNGFRALNTANPVFRDAAGNVWMGSWGGGMIVFDPEFNFTLVSPNPDQAFLWKSSLSEDDTIAVQSPPEMQGLLNGVSTNFRFTVVTDMLNAPSRGSIWILNYFPANGLPLVEYPAASFDFTGLPSANIARFPVPSSSSETHKITRDVFGDFWVATNNSGVVQIRLKGDTLQSEHYTESNDNLKSNSTLAIAADQDGYVWVGTPSGLSAILGGAVFDFRENFQPVGLRINDIFVDSQNNKWFATDKGLSVLQASGSPFDPLSWVDIIPINTSIDPAALANRRNLFQENLPTEEIHSVFLDEQNGDVYLGTDAGIVIIRNNPFASVFTNYDNLKVGPNPFILDDRQNNRLNFLNLVAGSEVKILTANGQLIRRLSPNDFREVKGAVAQWDGKNAEGRFVSSGVYLYLITTEAGEKKSGKVLVIRQ